MPEKKLLNLLFFQKLQAETYLRDLLRKTPRISQGTPWPCSVVGSLSVLPYTFFFDSRFC